MPQGGTETLGARLARVAWPVGVAVVWPGWYLLYALAFSVLNEFLTRLGALPSENGMLIRPLEIGVQAVLAVAFGLLGIALVRLAKAPKNVWVPGAVMSVVLSLATVAVWTMSPAGAGADGVGGSYGAYALIGVVMGAGCWVGSIVVGRREP